MLLNSLKSVVLWLVLIQTANAAPALFQKMKSDKKFDWSATLSAPEEYPVQVYRGGIGSEGYTQSLQGFGTIDYGWGEGGGYVVMGPDLKSIPDSLEIAWHSFVDQKNYEGKWDLPKEDITKLFDEGFTDNSKNKKTTYTTFVVGLAPNGLVVVWLSGAGNQIEVAHFKAQEALINIENISDRSKSIFSKKYNDVVLSELNESYNTFERIENDDYPKKDLYEEYREKYLWRHSIVLPQGGELKNLIFHLYNGEFRRVVNDGLMLPDYKKLGVFRRCYFHWVDKNQNLRGVWIEEFDDEELYRAYEELGKETPLDLVVKMVEPSTVSIILKNNTREIEIKKFKKTVEHLDKMAPKAGRGATSL